MKTLGQIAYEARYLSSGGRPGYWDAEGPRLRADWEAAARAVAEECAKICDAQALEPECPERATYCAEAILERAKEPMMSKDGGKDIPL